MRKANGITLVILVITIVLILILAGVSLNYVMNEDIFQKANSTKRLTEANSILKEIELQYLNYIRTGPDVSVDGFFEYIEKKGIEKDYISIDKPYIEIDGYQFELISNENNEINIKYVKYINN